MAQLRTVDLQVAAELVDHFEANAHLLAPARIISKEPMPDKLIVTYRMHHPDAPEHAAAMTPIFERTPDGTVRLQSTTWLDAHGQHIGQS